MERALEEGGGESGEEVLGEALSGIWDPLGPWEGPRFLRTIVLFPRADARI